MTNKKEEISIDMIRLKSRKDNIEIVDFFDRLKVVNNYNVAIEYYMQTKAAAFGYNYSIHTASGDFWMGCGHNSEKRGLKTNLYIEYNPNKLAGDEFVKFVLKRFFSSPSTEIVSCDVAKDLYYPMANFIGDMKHKRDIKIFNTSKGKTIYIGKGDGRAKLYDKGREQGLKGVDWTRFEISINVKEIFHKMSTFGYKAKNIPSVFYAEQDLSLSPEDKAVIYALSDNVINLNEFSRRKRDKYKGILSNYKEISIEYKEIYQLLNEYVEGVIDCS